MSGRAAEPDAVPTRHRWLSHGSEGLRYRMAVALRAVAAVGGGYAVGALASAALALWLPGSRSEAALTGTLAAFVVFTGAVMWAFAARTVLRAWLGLLVPAALLGGLVWLRYPGGVA